MNFENNIESIFEYLRKNTSTSITKLLEEFTRGEIGVLGYLAFENDGATSGELSEKINVTTARIASILNSLENKKYIKRNNDYTDKRKVVVNITEKGMELAINTKKEIMSKLEKIISEIGFDDINNYIRINMKIKEILNKQ